MYTSSETTTLMMLHHRQCSVSTMNAIKLFSEFSEIDDVEAFYVSCVSMCARPISGWQRGMSSKLKSQSSVRCTCMGFTQKKKAVGEKEKIENSTKFPSE